MMKKALLLILLLLMSSLAVAQPEPGIKLNVKGLDVAISKAKNNETQAHLEAVMAKILQHRQEQLNRLKNLTVEGDGEDVYVEGQGTGKFLGLISVKKQYKYEVLENGEIKRVKRIRDTFVTDDPYYAG